MYKKSNILYEKRKLYLKNNFFKEIKKTPIKKDTKDKSIK